MRFGAACLIILLAGCDADQSFDKQYDETANDIQNRASRIDNDLNAAGNEAEVTKAPS